MLSEHGFSEFACWSHVSFACLTPEEVEAQAGTSLDRTDLEGKACRGGCITMAGKSCTEHSIANGAVTIIRAIAISARTSRASGCSAAAEKTADMESSARRQPLVDSS